MTSPGATAVSSTSVPMRYWARLRVTGGGGGDDFAMGMIAQAVKNGIQASRKRAAWRCIGSESSKEQTQCHGGKRVTPMGAQKQRGVYSRVYGASTAKRPAALGYAGAGPASPLLLTFCYNGAAMKPYVLKRDPDSPAEPKFSLNYEAELNPGQLAAVKALDGPILVIAGAGSGKTRTLVYRLARLLESGIPPAATSSLPFR